MNIDELFRNFHSDPSPESARILFYEMVRSGLKMPNNFDEIKKFCRYNKKKMEFYISVMNYGEPANFAFYMFRDYSSDINWAKRAIESSKIGDPSWTAYKMIEYISREIGWSERVAGSLKFWIEWAEKVIENATSGDPSFSAYLMVRDFESSREWAKKIIENAKTGNPPMSADFMSAFFGFDHQWAKEIKNKWDRIKLEKR